MAAALVASTSARAERLGPRGQLASFRVDAPGAPRTVLARAGEIAVAKLGPGAKARSVLSGTLHATAEGNYLLIAGGDGGATIEVDGKPVFQEAAPRANFAPGDVVPVHLGAGAHTVTATLTKSQSFSLRAVGSDFRPSSALEWVVTGAPADPSDLALDVGAAFEPAGVRLTIKLARARSTAEEQASPIEVEVRGAVGVLFAASAGRLPYPRAETTLALPSFPMADAALITVTVRHGVRSTTTSLHFHAEAQHAVVRARAAAGGTLPSTVKPGSQDSVLHLADVLEDLERTQDPDQAFAAQTVRELDALSTKLEAGADPYEGRTGPQRRALRSPVDGKLYEFGLYVPAKPKSEKEPLIVILHGLHGRPMTMLRYLFGGDDANKTPVQKDRSWDASLPALDAYAIAPSGHGDSTYRWLGEDESLRLIDWAKTVYGIDADKITMTGASMGGIGAAAIPFHHPGVFAAAAPLCGYHSYFLRSDVTKFSKLAYERFQAEERSNVMWAENGHDLPLFVAHGTMDLPEANSGVLIDRYEELKYRIVHEHPHVGHNVWQPTYENLKGARWLLSHTRTHPSRLHFRTVRPRYGQSYWLRVLAQERSGEWTDVRARREKDLFTLVTMNVRELFLDRVESTVGSGAVHVMVDGAALEYAEGEPLAAHKTGTKWRKGVLADPHAKRGLRTGPFRDLYHEPLAFVFGTQDPTFTTANEEVARYLSHVKPGVRADYPILRDDQATGAISPGTSIVLIGPASSNSLRAALDAKLPSHVTGTTLTFAGQKYEGPGVGVAYIYPHPDDPAAYVAVVEGVDPIGVRTALALPELLPDWIVFDRGLAAARGQILLGRGKVRAAGFFDASWNVPEAAK